MLIYVGTGAYLIGVPSRDLTEKEINSCAYTEEELLTSGLYARVAKTKKIEQEGDHGNSL